MERGAKIGGFRNFEECHPERAASQYQVCDGRSPVSEIESSRNRELSGRRFCYLLSTTKPSPYTALSMESPKNVL